MAFSLHNLCVFVFLSFVILFANGLPNRCHPHESQSLLLFITSFNVSTTDPFFNVSSWVNGSDCCTSWDGVECDNHTNHVISLNVECYYRVHPRGGVIPASLCHLRFLKSLFLSSVTGTLPPCFSNLSHLQILLVADNKMRGIIPTSICLLTNLRILNFGFNELNAIPSCLSNLSSLTHLVLNDNQFSGSIPASPLNIFSLTHLALHNNQLSGRIPASVLNLSSLTHLALHNNQLSGSIPASLSSLIYLSLGSNRFNESIPTSLLNLSSLTNVDISNNQLSGSIPVSFATHSSLEYLDLSYNYLNGSILASLGSHSSLRNLNLDHNKLSGTIPSSFAHLSSLTHLTAIGNEFNETISSSSLPSSITTLYLSLNHRQSISETFFYGLSKLENLYLSNCLLNISTTWIPSFQLQQLSLISCRIGGPVPPWISTQFSMDTIELADNNLVGDIPSWLLDNNPYLNILNLSRNNLQRSLFSNNSILMQLSVLDLSYNSLIGNIPSLRPPNLEVLLLNNNFFSGKIPPSFGSLSGLQILNLAINNLTGTIPVDLGNCSELRALNLGKNSLTGRLPHEFSKLRQLYSFVVPSNKLKGLFPPSILNCSDLQVLDIGHNSFEGHIPNLVGNLSKLRVLVMKENNFRGSIPEEIGQLKNLQILLLSSNHISGFIPHTILYLQAMANASQDGFVLSTFASTSYYQEEGGIDMTFKGIDLHYTYILSTLTALDLSNNELEGELPYDFGNLKGLRLLNLSMNNFKGNIPKSLGEMSQLESLDLSINKFSGNIPGELESLNYLGSFNLSNNNLSGSIPQGRHMTGTFGESSYSGNPNLWGCPLPKKCSWPQFSAPPPVSINQKDKSVESPWYDIAVGLSCAAGFGGTLALIIVRMSWRKKYFEKVDIILKFLFPWLKNWTL